MTGFMNILVAIDFQKVWIMTIETSYISLIKIQHPAGYDNRYTSLGKSDVSAQAASQTLLQILHK